MSATENRYVNLYVDSKNARKSISEIRSEVRRLNSYINRSTLSQKEYNEATKKLGRLNKVLDQHRQKIRGVNRSWETVKSTAIGVGAGMVVQEGLQRLVAFGQNVIDGNAKLSDSFADVRKTTGLTDEGVRALSASLKMIDTRTSRTRLLELARDAGKLGITGVENLSAFVKAADQIDVALGEDLGDDAIKTIGKLNNLFGTSELFGYEQGMLKIGSVINELGASSEAAEANIVGFTSRLAGIGSQSGITVDQIAAMGATLDSLGQRTEMSSTAISQAIVGMFDDTATYAKVAGVELSEFSSLLETDANEAFLLFLEGLAGNNEGLGVLTQKFDQLGINGSRAIQVLAALGGNTKLLREQQTLANRAFDEGISLTTEFSVKNNTLAGDLEKIGKRLNAIWVSSALNDAVKDTVKSFKNFLEVPVSEGIEKQRRSFNGLMQTLMDTNTTEENRLKIIKELQSQYGARLTNINLETASYHELEAAMKAVNQQFFIEIMLQKQKERLQEAAEDAADEKTEELEAQIRANGILAEANQNLGTSYRSIQEALDGLGETAAYNMNQLSGITTPANDEARFLSDLAVASNELSREQREARVAVDELNQVKKDNLDMVQQLKEEYPELAEMIDNVWSGVSSGGVTPDPVQAAQGPTGQGTSTTEATDPVQAALDEIKAAADAEMLYLEQHRAEQLISAELFEEEKLGIKLTYLLMEKEAMERFGKDTVAIDREIAQTEIQLMELKINAAKKEDQVKEKLHKKDEKRIQQEIDWRRRAAEAAVNSAFMRGIAAVEAAQNEHEAAIAVMQTLRSIIKEQINQAIAAVVAKELAKFGPLGILTGALAGAAVSALFDSLIPPIQMPPPPEFAEGTSFFGGSAVVGDQGREQVNLPLGSQVVPAEITQLLNASRNFAQPVPQPNFSAINDGLTFRQSQQILNDAPSSLDINPLISEIRLLGSNIIASQRNQQVILSKEDLNRFNDREDENISRTMISRN